MQPVPAAKVAKFEARQQKLLRKALASSSAALAEAGLGDLDTLRTRILELLTGPKAMAAELPDLASLLQHGIEYHEFREHLSTWMQNPSIPFKFEALCHYQARGCSGALRAGRQRRRRAHLRA